ncbi:MAG: helix-turn-helix domain-containing protein, partial [Candidatus Thermoplasmatota archaeon]|nr:helix-turn-helix domain-containing protein [Candidatus Thermoplasmatota archaeon]
MSQPTLMAPLPQARAWWLAVFLASSDPLEAENRRRLYRALNQFPGLHLAALAREADVDERLARYHIRVLVKSGLAT